MSYDAPSKYQGTGTYGVLTAGEQTTWGEYTNLRAISDWPGFDTNQDQRRADSRSWLTDRMAELVDLAATDGGWDKANRGQRYDFLTRLNSGAPKHEVRLPCPGSATDTEKSYTEEREQYLAWGSQYDAQKARKQANVDWLVSRRKQLWHLMRDDPDGNGPNDRQNRYDALCIATHYGSAYESWNADHNKWGVPYTPESSGGRSACKDWLESYLGVSENPANSNRGQPQPSKWQTRVYGTDGVPWCACFAVCSAWDNGISGSGTASVYQNVQLAKQGKGIYRGWTMDPSKVHAGDHCFIGSDHTGVIYDASTGETIEGNTSPASGGSSSSQYNGGCVAKRQRGWSYWTAGFGLVRFDD